MPVIIKSPGTNFLMKVGVSEALIQKMNDAEIKLVLGFKDFSFVNKENLILAKGFLPTSANILVKGASPELTLKSKQELEAAVQIALNAVLVTSNVQLTAQKQAEVSLNINGDPIVQDAAKKKTWPSKGQVSVETAMEAMAGTTLKQAMDAKIAAESKKKSLAEQAAAAAKEKLLTAEQQKVAKVSKKNELWKQKGIMHLKDATEIYQQVHGTSSGSVYVAIAVNESVRIAARIKGGSLSVRIEGEFTDKIRKALAAQGLQPKGKVSDGNGAWEYMSGHFECGNVQPERVVGAILFGCGLPFDTPIPDMKKVRDLGK